MIVDELNILYKCSGNARGVWREDVLDVKISCIRINGYPYPFNPFVPFRIKTQCVMPRLQRRALIRGPPRVNQ